MIMSFRGQAPDHGKLDTRPGDRAQVARVEARRAAASAASPHQPSFVLPRASAFLTVGRNLLTTANQTIGASTVTPVEAPCSLTSMVGLRGYKSNPAVRTGLVGRRRRGPP